MITAVSNFNQNKPGANLSKYELDGHSKNPNKITFTAGANAGALIKKENGFIKLIRTAADTVKGKLRVPEKSEIVYATNIIETPEGLTMGRSPLLKMLGGIPSRDYGSDGSSII